MMQVPMISLLLMLSLQVSKVFTYVPKPKISVYPCNVPMASYKFALCCQTTHIYTSRVYVFKTTETNIIADIDDPCNIRSSNTSDVTIYRWHCNIIGKSRIINITFTQLTSDSIGLWGCGYFGGRSTYHLTASKVITINGGFQYVQANNNVTLTWSVNTTDFNVFRPNGLIIDKSQLNVTTVDKGELIVNAVLTNVTSKENGTYICSSNNNTRRNGLTVIVLEKPSKPAIREIGIHFDKDKMDVNLTCHSKRIAIGPAFYIPAKNVSWLYSPFTNYSIDKFMSNLIIQDFTCAVIDSKPVFCSVKEDISEWSPRGFIYPHKLCRMMPTTVLPPETTTVNAAVGAAVAGMSGSFPVIIILVIALSISYKNRSRQPRTRSRCRNFPCCCRHNRNDNDVDTTEAERIRNLYEERLTIPVIINNRNNYGSLNHPRPGIDNSDQAVIGVQANNGNLPNSTVPRPSNGNPPNSTAPRPSNGNPPNATASRPSNGNPPNATASRPSNGNPPNATASRPSNIVDDIEQCLQRLNRLVRTAANVVQIRRTHIVEDFLNIYTDSAILKHHLYVQITGEVGSDWGGVSRDAFTTFWQMASTTYFKGNAIFVPHLSLVNMEDENTFIKIGRILSHSTAILRFMPIQLSKSTMIVLIYNSTEVDDNTLIEDFLNYVEHDERMLLKQAINNFATLSETQIETLQNLFFRFDMSCLVKATTFRSQLVKIARNELCLKPRPLCEKIRQGIPDDHFEEFWSHLTVDHITRLHFRLKPTVEKVLECIKPEEPFRDLTRCRRNVYQYFQKFIKHLDENQLQLLLQLITGQTCVPTKTIQVVFSNLSGFGRRPVFHTCGYLVEIPDTYRNYKEFESEMKNIMSSDVLHFDLS